MSESVLKLYTARKDRFFLEKLSIFAIIVTGVLWKVERKNIFK